MKLIFILASLLMTFGLFAQESIVNVGIHTTDIEPEVGIPLAGYGAKERRLKGFIDWTNKHPHSFFFKPSTGQRDPIQSKVMVIEQNGKYLVFISLDMIGVTANFIETMIEKLYPLGITQDQVFITATHTHSGPGTLSRSFFLNLVAVDMFKRKNYEHVVNKVYDSVVSALLKLEPADLYASSFDAQNIQQNKFRKHDQNWFNNKASFILAKSKQTNQWLGGMLNFAVHGNAMPVGDLRYSGDFPAALARQIETRLADKNIGLDSETPILFMNGAEGDVRHKGDRGEVIMESVAEQFGVQAEVALNENNMRKLNNTFSYASKNIFIGIPGYPLKVCGKRDGWYKDWMKIILLGKAARIPVVPFFPMTVNLSIAKIDDIVMMTFPGEASTQVGWNLQNMAREQGWNNSWVLGLTSDYLTYFTTKEEYFEAAYDSCSSMYNWRGANRVIKGHKKLLERL